MENVEASSVDFGSFLALRQVSVMRSGRIVLHDVSLSIRAGEHIALLGPNGSGKSSLMKMITRECYPIASEHSSMRIFGRSVWNIFELRTLLGIVSPDLAKRFDDDLTGREAILSGFFSGIGLSEHDAVTDDMKRKTESVLSLLEAKHLGERLMAEMSTGEARRILIARTLVHDPKTLILDEPCTGLDMRARRDLLDVLSRIARGGTGILLVTHDYAEIFPEIARVLFIRGGRIIADGAREDLLTNEGLSALFETEIHTIQKGIQ